MTVASPVSLVFVAWNARAHLARALDAVRALPCPVIVVDNASTDGTAEAVRVGWPDVRLLAVDRNLGFAGGANLGIQASNTPWVVLLNPDILLSSDALEQLLAAGEASPDIGAVGAQLVGPGGEPQPAYSIRRLPTLGTWAADLLLIDHLWPDNPASTRYLAADLDRTRDQDVEQPAGACLLIRRAAFDAIGGFDPRFQPAWFEDVDFCRRLHDGGWRIRYVAGARVIHEGGVAMRTLGVGGFTRAWYTNLLRYARKHQPLASRVAVRLLLVVGLLLRALASVVRGRWDDARAYASLLTLRPD